MSIDVAFFSAPNDASAAEAERRPGGPLGWPVAIGTRKVGLLRKEPIFEKAGPAYDGFASRGYDGVVNMGTLEELLTGTRYEDLESDPRWGGNVSVGEDTDCVVLTLTSSLRDALAAADDQALEAIVEPWANTEELGPLDGTAPSQGDLAGHRAFLGQLRDLARRAKRDGHQLYWYFLA